MYEFEIIMFMIGYVIGLGVASIIECKFDMKVYIESIHEDIYKML